MTAKNKLLWSLMTLLAFAVGLYAIIPTIDGIVENFQHMQHQMGNLKVFAYTHFLLGGVAIIIGPTQFLPKLRQKYLTLHRRMGQAYVLACLLSGISAVIMATNANSNPVGKAGFALMAVFWLFTTVKAYLSIRKREVKQHQNWMIRSYALTLAAVSLRLQLPWAQMGLLPVDFATAYMIIAWSCWVPNLLIAQYFVHK